MKRHPGGFCVISKGVGCGIFLRFCTIIECVAPIFDTKCFHSVCYSKWSISNGPQNFRTWIIFLGVQISKKPVFGLFRPFSGLEIPVEQHEHARNYSFGEYVTLRVNIRCTSLFVLIFKIVLFKWNWNDPKWPKNRFFRSFPFINFFLEFLTQILLISIKKYLSLVDS